MISKRQVPVPIIEVGFSILSISLSLILFGSPEMFDSLPQTYEFFREIASESLWATVFLLAALTKILGLVTKRNGIRRVGLLASTVIYGLIASAYFLGAGVFSIGFSTYAVLAFMALFAVREVDLVNGE